MKIRAAVLEEFGSPLEVQELDLAERTGKRSYVVSLNATKSDLKAARRR